MKWLAIPLILFVFISENLFSQNFFQEAEQVLDARGEVYFRFNDPGPSGTHVLKSVSIDRVENGKVYAYASRKELEKVLLQLMDPEVLPSPSLKYTPRMATDLKQVQSWDYYPTYGQYVAMMDSFAAAHPALCRKEVFGTSKNGRELIVLKISDNVQQKEAEPEFLYTSSMHGDELTGAILMLRLIDYLLSNYGTDSLVTSLVDETEIWINPLANPDGTYFIGNNTVAGAIRYNANFVDLNRNFPDPQDGQHPDGNDWQPENIAWMDFMAQHQFVMSANFHGGAELMNYPWDTYAQLHPDDDWLQLVSREFADSAQFYGPAGYFNDENNGITNGNAWYEIDGGRQDYANFFHHCREICIEISADKKPDASDLPGFWDANYRSLLYYIQQVQYGIRGVVTDSLTGVPLKAFVEVMQHDADSSQIYTADSINGNYHRLIKGGVYDLRFSAPGYIPKTIPDVAAADYDQTWLDVQLVKDMQNILYAGLDALFIFPNPANDRIFLRNISPESVVIKIYDLKGKTVREEYGYNASFGIDVSELPRGYYRIQVVGDGSFSAGILVE